MDRILEWLFVCAVLFVVVMASIMVIDTVYHHYQQEHAQVESTKGWTPPKIPKCDKELWDRIRGEC